MLFIDSQVGLRDGIIDAIVDIERTDFLIAHAVSAHVALVRKNQGSGKRADGNAGAFVMVPDGGHDYPDLVSREPQMVEEPERHNPAGLAMFHPIDEVTDVMQVASDFGELDSPLRIAERLEDVARFFRNHGDMRKAVFGIAEGLERKVRLADVGLDFFVLSDFLIIHCYVSFGGLVLRLGVLGGRHCAVARIWRALTAYPEHTRLHRGKRPSVQPQMLHYIISNALLNALDLFII